MSLLVDSFQEYSTWRFALSQAIRRYAQWLEKSRLSDGQVEMRLDRALERLTDDKLSIAFVAEFSRGKSELINAIFFADYGKRILPSSAGRTTMCPTELQYDDAMEPSIRLLPIETRAKHASTSEYKLYPEEWTIVPLDTSSGDGMLEAFKRVCETKRVPVDVARSYSLFDPEDPNNNLIVDAAGTVEISRWRHAIINFPHPLLEQGLVILDTPGLNAIGSEPELTLNLIPSAHAVLFILAADTGVTKSDIEIWTKHVGGGKQKGRMVVLNKIDSMWDELKKPAEIDAEIEKQAVSVAKTLELERDQIFPISAQKGLVAKVNHDDKLLRRSRLPLLERALSFDLIPAKQRIISEQIESELEGVMASIRNLLQARQRNIVEQLFELRSLRGKNRGVMTHMVARVKQEKEEFDQSLMRLQAVRAVYTKLNTEIFTALGMEALKSEIGNTREAMLSSRLTIGMRSSMDEFFKHLRARLETVSKLTAEITEMMQAMYRKFSEEHGLTLRKPMQFSVLKFSKEIDRIERIYQRQFSFAKTLRTEQLALTQRFFESIAGRTRETFEIANRDVEAWLKAVMAPMEAQVREHQIQLRRRLESIKRIHEATGTLEQRIAELEEHQTAVETQMCELDDAANNVVTVLKTPMEEAQLAA
ncbi:MAG: GTPase [Burkholderiaceae bacterium]|nr:MAG: GTPase [Burkholderiaceae bacterium]